MCGIWLDIGGRGGGTAGADVGGRALEAMAHRGPDARQLSRITIAGRDIELGHVRLSIIDLDTRSNQPMTYGDQLVIVFNGEIYNFVELREELQRLGHVFATSSDTEVLLAAYAAWGPQMLPRLRGMFAFALVDKALRRILLARDPFGIKPLFVAHTASGIVAASEIAPLLAVPGVSRRARCESVFAYLMHGATDAGSATFLADIDSLPAAHYALIQLDEPQPRLTPQRYWRPVYEATITSPQEAARLVRERFLDSVRLHLRADVPLGTMLSGGIDSSAIVAAVRQQLGPAGEIHTFSFVSPGDPLDETRYIRTMVRAAGTISHEVEADAAMFRDDLDTLVVRQGEPFGSTSIYAQYRVAAAARAAGIKVLLDGQGSDELFAGYRFYLGARIAGLIAAGEPLRAARVLARVARLPGVRLPSQIHHMMASLDLPVLRGLSRRAAARQGPQGLIAPTWLAADAGRSISRTRMPRRLALLERLHASLEEDVLPGLLRYEDRCTMAHSIEARVPFLDVPLAEVACRLAPELLVDDNGTTKSVLRAALRGLVPDEILDRRDKIGFATPEARWLRAAAPWLEERLARIQPEEAPYLKLEATKARLREMMSGQRHWQPWGWRAINLLLWGQLNRIEFQSR
jgi:asparagine synthase (glutamine-hydrolysing)